MSMKDKEIIELLFLRSERAISELDRKYGRICRKIAFNILNNLEDAEECTNDTYLGIWNSIPPESPDPLAAYVFKIAKNSALKKYRYNTAKKRNSHYDISLSELEDYIPAAETNGGTCGEEELKGVLESFLDSLDKKSRVMFIKRYWYSELVKDIAEEFGITENHAAVKLSRIRNKMKAYLEKKGVTL